MGIIPGLIWSRPALTPIRVSETKMKVKEIYINNDHLVDYRIQERTRGTYKSGLSLTAYLSRNPTGSAITSQYLTTPVPTYFATSSFALTQTFSESLDLVSLMTSSFTTSVYEVVSESFTASVSQSNTGNISLSTGLTELASTGEYIGTIPGASITTALSGSFEEAFYTIESGSVVTTATASIVSQSATELRIESTSFVTTAAFSQSFTRSIEVPVEHTNPRAFSIYEIITTNDGQLQVATPMNLRSVRFLP